MLYQRQSLRTNSLLSTVIYQCLLILASHKSPLIDYATTKRPVVSSHFSFGHELATGPRGWFGSSEFSETGACFSGPPNDSLGGCAEPHWWCDRESSAIRARRKRTIESTSSVECRRNTSVSMLLCSYNAVRSRFISKRQYDDQWKMYKMQKTISSHRCQVITYRNAQRAIRECP